MKARELLNMGFKQGPIIGLLLEASRSAKARGMSASQIRKTCQSIRFDPRHHTSDIDFGKAASELVQMENPATYELVNKEYRVWGEHLLDSESQNQMRRAMDLPISVAGAIMADGHQGYGLPIGGVWAVDNAVVPYAVGVDIACQIEMSVLPMEIRKGEKNPIDRYRESIKKAIEDNTRFGMGAEFDHRTQRSHDVMDMDWNVSPITAQVKDKAARQLGSSGSGNHFVDVCEIEFEEAFQDVPAGTYVAIMTHSGSRGAGANVANFYSKLAMSKHPKLPKEYKHLAWMELGGDGDGDGDEYWLAMKLMGAYASANHDCIHSSMLKDLGVDPILQVKNLHNFAWKEVHGDKEVIVHRKGATPSGQGVMGIIPGSMGDYAYLVEGKGNPDSLNSSSHGAGRAMSRKKAKESFRMNQALGMLKAKGVELISGGLDEVPGAYKSISDVMAEQDDLVTVIARLFPRIVKMSDDGKAED